VFGPSLDLLWTFFGRSLDSNRHALKFWITGYVEPLLFEVTAAENARVWRAIRQVEEADQNYIPFVVFDSDRSFVGVNLGVVKLCQFLWEPSVTGDPSWPGVDNCSVNADAVKIYCTDSEQPIDFCVDIESSPEATENNDFFGDIFMQMKGLVFPTIRWRFDNIDGENVFIRAASLALLEVPRVILHADEFEL